MTKTPADKLIRARAVSYAKMFLVKKYYSEYQELYQAYCKNRGVGVRRLKVTDEREVMEYEIDALPIHEVEELQA